MQHFLAMLHRSFAHCCLNYLKVLSKNDETLSVQPITCILSVWRHQTPDSRQCPGCGQQRLCRDQTRCHNAHWSLAPSLELQTTVHTKVRNHDYQGLHLVHHHVTNGAPTDTKYTTTECDYYRIYIEDTLLNEHWLAQSPKAIHPK